jgi:hypothetical protein
MLYDMILTAAEIPAWLDQIVWTGRYVIFTLFPTIKYFKTDSFTPDMKVSFGGSTALAWITGFVLFFAVLKGDFSVESDYYDETIKDCSEVLFDDSDSDSSSDSDDSLREEEF